jgi:hypothetical protein
MAASTRTVSAPASGVMLHVHTSSTEGSIMTHKGSLRLLAVLAAITTLTGCANDRRGAEEEVRRNLKDPESAQFGNFYYSPTTKKACLVVNAKNSMGGYNGNSAIVLNKTDEGWEYVSDSDDDFDTCKAALADKGD